MRRANLLNSLLIAATASALLAFMPVPLLAHCDTMDGPVVKAARKALETGNVNFVLIWVQEKDEAEIREVFQKTLAVRKLNPEARKLADLYFFETLVRLHRAGEGAPYTGLKPSGTPLEPGVAAADAAIEKGSAAELLKDVTEMIRREAEDELNSVLVKSRFDPTDVVAGRGFVEAYVTFVHYAERLYEAGGRPAHGHYPQNEQTSMHQEH